MAHAMTRHATGLILDGGDSELGRVIEQSLDGANSRKTAGALSDIRSRQFLQEVADGRPISQSLDNLSESAPFASSRQTAELQAVRQRAGSWPEPNQILQRLENHPPGIDSLPEQHAKLSKAGTHVDNLVQHLTPAGQRARGAQFADSVAQYGDWFPSYSGADRATIRGQLLDAWESNTSLHAQLEQARSAHGPLPESIAGIDPNRPPVEGASGGGGGGGGGSKSGNSTKTPPKSPNSGTGAPRPSPSRTPQVRNASFASSSSGASTRSSFLRARSFRGLRGFARVGGVLIGNEPDSDSSQLDLRELTWKLDDSGLVLITRNADGHEHRSRTFRTSVARQALAYAADGRPLAVTMVTATPLSELRILLHPALIDTPLGARVIEIDRFVDVFTGSEDSEDDFRGDASAFVIHSTRLYEFARALRLTSAHDDILSLTEKRLNPESHAAVRGNLEDAAEIVDDPQFLGSVAVAILQLDGLKDPNRTPLKAKPEFYDQGLVDAIISVADEANGDLSKFIPLFSGKFKTALKHSKSPLAGLNLGNLDFEGLDIGQFDASDAKVDKMIEWFKPAPTFEIWSGVREKRFRPTLDELLPVASDSTLPLNFMLQVAFTSFPAYLDGTSELDGASEDEEYTDDNPWEFPSIADAIHRTVIDEVGKNERSGEILKDVAEFTVLQRFFRAALDGQLGEEFPIEELGELQDACLQDAPQTYWRTLRWNSRDGSLEATLRAQLLQLDESPQTKSMLERLEQNFALRDERDEAVAELLGDRSADEAPDAEWTKRWDKVWEDANSQLTAWEEAWVRDYDGTDAVGPDAASAVTWFTNVVQIRRALGVSVDDAQSRKDSRIPIPPL